jgi:signal transduction histidine kinase
MITTNLELESTVQELSLWEVCIELDKPTHNLNVLFQENPLMPGILLNRSNTYVGMISRQNFFEFMSRPHSAGLFSERPIEHLYNFLQSEIFILPEDTSIINATQTALQRKLESVYEPIVVKSQSDKYKILDIQQLLLAYSKIQALTLNRLQKSQQESKIAQTDFNELKQNYTKLVRQEKTLLLSTIVGEINQEINNPAKLIAGNLIHVSRYIQELVDLVSLYTKHYPEPITEIKTVINQTKVNSLINDLPKLINSTKNSARRIQSSMDYLRSLSITNEIGEKD